MVQTVYFSKMKCKLLSCRINLPGTVNRANASFLIIFWNSVVICGAYIIVVTVLEKSVLALQKPNFLLHCDQ